MKYVKHFTINGINTTQVGCIELNGRPNAATTGAVGLLGIDVTSPTHDVYKCVAVNGSIYTWELLSSGMSVLCANITGEGGLTKTFPYSDLRIPDNYLIKVGDLILDSEGYLYQINALGNESCDTAYTNVHLAGGSNGKDYKLKLTDGRLQLVTESGAVISDVEYSNHDDITIVRDNAGKTKVVGVYTIGGSVLHFFIGTQEEYDALEHKDNLFAIITDDPTPAQLREVLADHPIIKDKVNILIDYATNTRQNPTLIAYPAYTDSYCTLTHTHPGGTIESFQLDMYTGFDAEPTVSIAGDTVTIKGKVRHMSAGIQTTCSAKISYLLKPTPIT